MHIIPSAVGLVRVSVPLALELTPPTIAQLIAAADIVCVCSIHFIVFPESRTLVF